MEKGERLYGAILQQLGEDTWQERLGRTPRRAAKAWKALTRGYLEEPEKIVNGAIFSCDSDELVVVRGIAFCSIRASDLIPFTGQCHVGYLPQGKVIGLSKIARLVDLFARRLQQQEKLTWQIAEAIQRFTAARGMAVVIEASHPVIAEGEPWRQANVKTSHFLGVFQDDVGMRQEFERMI